MTINELTLTIWSNCGRLTFVAVTEVCKNCRRSEHACSMQEILLSNTTENVIIDAVDKLSNWVIQSFISQSQLFKSSLALFIIFNSTTINKHWQKYKLHHTITWRLEKYIRFIVHGCIQTLNLERHLTAITSRCRHYWSSFFSELIRINHPCNLA